VDYIRREGLSTDALLPTPLRLRKEVELLPETVKNLRSEQAVRDVVAKLNRRIADWLRVPIGPQVHLMPVDADDVVRQWRAARAPDEVDRATAAAPASRRRDRRWRRRKSG
jgi:hypothetical protein